MKHKIAVAGVQSEVETAFAAFNRGAHDGESEIASWDYVYSNRTGGGWVTVELTRSGALLLDIITALNNFDLIA